MYMKKLLTALLGLAFLLGACGGNDGGNVSDDASNGERVFQENCASCHGDNLSGRSAPAIAGTDVADVLSAIEEGPGTMPPSLVSGQDAEDVADWVANYK